MNIQIKDFELFKSRLKEWSDIDDIKIEIKKDYLSIYLSKPYNKSFILEFKDNNRNHTIEIEMRNGNLFLLRVNKKDEVLLINAKSNLNNLNKNIRKIWALNILKFHFLSGFDNLTSLYVYSKDLQNLKTFPELDSLKILDLGNCGSLNDISDIKKFKKLETLDLNYTKIKNVNSLKKLKNLKILELYRCEEIEDLSGLLDLENLKELNLEKTKIGEVNSLKNLKKLKKLKIGGAYFERINLIGISNLSGLENLEELNLSYTDIKKIDFLKNLKNLKKLHLNGNEELKDISGLSELINLEELDLSGTRIKSVNSLMKLKNLKNLKLSSCNSLVDISGLSKLKNVKELNLSGTKIKNISSLKNIKTLKKIEINNCTNLEDISVLSNLEEIEYLYLFNTNMRNIESLKKLKNLKILFLYNDKIDDITAISNSKNLEHLFIISDNLENISILKNMKKLKILTIHSKKLEDISVLSTLKKLEELDLSNTKIKNMNPLKNLKNLRKVKVDKCEYLEDLSGIYHIKNLEIDFSETKIKNVDFLKGARNLKKLILNRCKTLTDISAIKDLNIEYLNIRGCPSIKDTSFLKDIKSLKKFDYDSPYFTAEVLSSNAYNRKDELYIIENISEWISLLENAPELEPLTSDLLRALSIVSDEKFKREKLEKILNIVLKRKDIEPKTLENILKLAIELENYKESFEIVKERVKGNVELIVPVIDSLLSGKDIDKEYSKSFINDCLKDKEFEKDDLLKIAPSIIVFYKIMGDEESYNEWLKKDELKSTIAKDKINEKFALYCANKNDYEKAEKYINQIKSEKIKDNLYYELSIKTSKTKPLKTGEYFDKIADKSKKLELSKKLMKVKEFLNKTTNLYKLTLFLEEDEELFSELVETMVENAKPELSQKFISVFSDEEEDEIMNKIMEFLDSELISEYIGKRKLEKFKKEFLESDELKKEFVEVYNALISEE